MGALFSLFYAPDKQDQEHAIEPALQDFVLDGGYDNVIDQLDPNCSWILDLNFSVKAIADWRDSYYILLKRHRPENKDVWFIFPNHPVVKLRLLRASDYKKPESVNLQLQERLDTARQVNVPGLGSFKVAVAYGECLYRLVGLEGTLYLLWAEYLKRQSGFHGLNLATDEPLLWNMTGECKTSNVFWLRQSMESTQELQGLPLSESRLTVGLQVKYMPFIHETPPTNKNKTKVKTASRLQVVQTATTQVSKKKAGLYKGKSESEDEAETDDDSDSGLVESPHPLEREYGRLAGVAEPEDPVAIHHGIGTHREYDTKKMTEVTIDQLDALAADSPRSTSTVPLYKLSASSKETSEHEDDPFASSDEDGG